MAIAIAAIVVTIVNSTFFQSHRVIETVTAHTRSYQMVRIAMDRIVRDVSCAYVPAQDRGMEDADIAMYRFVGKDDVRDGADNDSIFFTTVSELGMSRYRGAICEVDYFLREIDGKPGLYYLIRREDCTTHGGITEAGSEMEIAEDVVAFNLVYLDENLKETDRWDMEERLRLPDQVKISLTFRKEGQDMTFSALASLPLSEIVLKRKEDEEAAQK